MNRAAHDAFDDFRRDRDDCLTGDLPCARCGERRAVTDDHLCPACQGGHTARLWLQGKAVPPVTLRALANCSRYGCDGPAWVGEFTAQLCWSCAIRAGLAPLVRRNRNGDVPPRKERL